MILFCENNQPINKVYITENQENILKEMLSSIVYHFTSLMAAQNIVENDVIYLQSPLGNAADNQNTKQQFYLSTTRQKSSQFGYSQKFSKSGVRITLDGDLLNQRFKSKAINYWGDMGKESYYKNDKSFKDRQHHTDNESEDRLFSYDSKIENAHKYIKRIDIVLNKENKEALIIARNIYISHFSSKVFIYDNRKDFDTQSKNTINDEIREMYDISNLKVTSLDRNRADTITIAKVLLLIFIGEVDNNKMNEEAAKLLKKYSLEKYINKELFRQMQYYNIEDLVSTVRNNLYNYSNHPTEDKSKVLQMLSDYFKNHGFKTYRDVLKYKIELRTVATNSKLENIYDVNKEIKMFTLHKGNWDDYILGEDLNNVKFKDLFTDKYDLDSFIENVEYSAQDYYTSKDDYHFIQYLRSVINKGASVQDIYNICHKLKMSNQDISDAMRMEIRFEKISIYDNWKYKFLDEPIDISIHNNPIHDRKFYQLFKKE